LREEWYSQEEPDELVVDFIASMREERRKMRVLDLGCGAGRNLVHVASQGYEACGIDVAKTGLDFTRERLRKRSLVAYVARGDMNHLPWVDSCFDLVICLFSIYHQKLTGIQTTISEIHRILRKSGFLLVNFQSKKSGMYGKGVEIEKDTFARQNGPEKGVLHHFTDREELMTLFDDFRTVNVELAERKSTGGYLQSRWIVKATT
jgi:ubiquinone/menaquinone biosynthesis C-methylase UbiE